MTKKILYGLIVAGLLPILLVYLVFAYMLGGLNPMEWSELARVTQVFFTLMTVGVAGGAYVALTLDHNRVLWDGYTDEYDG